MVMSHEHPTEYVAYFWWTGCSQGDYVIDFASPESTLSKIGESEQVIFLLHIRTKYMSYMHDMYFSTTFFFQRLLYIFFYCPSSRRVMAGVATSAETRQLQFVLRF